ncbi:hypothetical protein V6N12_019250 [Hibiscus sabdariffa]|uniref:Putative plant transposon protein domain-containing protein n=1 Tax=Hibiscus sabdariffa TaxID=183260 RepID=A0ABR2C7D0_9ROSI
MANISSSARYAMVVAKNCWEEQGFFLDDSQDNATVRGRRVTVNAAIINSILGLPDDEPSLYAMLGALEDEDYEQIKDFLCEEGTAWNTTGRNPHSVSHPSLRPEAKLWNTFVKRNLMPTSHNQTVDRTRLVLIHTIMTGYRINVREILAKELPAACANDKGILAFPCLISALSRRAAVPTSPGDKYTAEKPGWTRAVYMCKMDVADATPINVALPTPPTSPIHMPVADTDEARPFVPAAAEPSAPVEARRSPAASPTVVPVSSHTTTTSPTTTPAVMPTSRETTPDSLLGSAPSSPSPPPPAQSEEATPLHILQLRNQLQRVEARKLQIQAETKPNPSANPSAKVGSTEEVHFSSDVENDVFDWQSPRDHLQPIDPTPSKPAVAVPILSPAPTPANSAIADRPTLDSPARRKGKAPAGRTISRHAPSSPDEDDQLQRPAKRQRRYHIITADSDDDSSNAIPISQPEKSLDPSLSSSF